MAYEDCRPGALIDLKPGERLVGFQPGRVKPHLRKVGRHWVCESGGSICARWRGYGVSPRMAYGAWEALHGGYR